MMIPSSELSKMDAELQIQKYPPQCHCTGYYKIDSSAQKTFMLGDISESELHKVIEISCDCV